MATKDWAGLIQAALAQPSKVFQQILGDPEAFPVQIRYINHSNKFLVKFLVYLWVSY